MRKIFALLTALSLVFIAWGQDDERSYDECTSLVVGRLATTDGSVITSHTCDGVSRTWINVVPASRHARKETVKIFKNTRRTAFDGDTTGVRYAGEIPVKFRGHLILCISPVVFMLLSATQFLKAFRS